MSLNRSINKDLAEIKCKKASELLSKAKRNHKPAYISQALTLYSEALKLCPEMPAPYYCIGYISYQLGEYEDAVKFLGKVVQLEPNNREANKLLSDSTSQLKRLKKSNELNQYANKALGEVLEEPNSSKVITSKKNVSDNLSVMQKNINTKNIKSTKNYATDENASPNNFLFEIKKVKRNKK